MECLFLLSWFPSAQGEEATWFLLQIVSKVFTCSQRKIIIGDMLRPKPFACQSFHMLCLFRVIDNLREPIVDVYFGPALHSTGYFSTDCLYALNYFVPCFVVIRSDASVHDSFIRKDIENCT